jgi:predicted nucleic-acid-binding protein
MLLTHKDLILQDSDMVAAALGLYKSHPALGFSDCLILHLARKAGHLPLGTFDRAGLAPVRPRLRFLRRTPH